LRITSVLIHRVLGQLEDGHAGTRAVKVKEVKDKLPDIIAIEER
jgi:hypothetical protein